MLLDRLATVSITPETISFVLRDFTGELLFFDIRKGKCNSVLDVLWEVSRPRGTVDYVYVNANWVETPQGTRIRDLDWPPFRREEVASGTSKAVELTTGRPDAKIAMLHLLQDHLDRIRRGDVSN